MAADQPHPLHQYLYPPLRLNAVDWLIYGILLGCTIGAGALVLAVWTGLEVIRGQRSPWIGLACGALLLSGLLIWLGLSPKQ